jgi:VanZ family protein
VLISLVVLFSPSTPSEAGRYGVDKLVHATLFAALAVATRLRFGRGLVLVLAYGCLSEVLQSVLPIHRDGGVTDALADAAGACLGWVFARRLVPRVGTD